MSQRNIAESFDSKDEVGLKYCRSDIAPVVTSQGGAALKSDLRFSSRAYIQTYSNPSLAVGARATVHCMLLFCGCPLRDCIHKTWLML